MVFPAIRETEVSAGPMQGITVTPEAIEKTKRSIALLQTMVGDMLERGVDYGRIPGTPADSLWDPGASQILGAFNSYPGERRFLKFEDTAEKIAVCVEVPIISRATGQVVTTGIGAASTLETKYKYRWEANPKKWGYDEEAIKTFKLKKGKDDDGNPTTLYRIPNPEHSELLNTIVKMATKRAEVDAAQSLPGVASVLRKIFTGAGRKSSPSGKGEYQGPVWDKFWGEVRHLGLTDQEAHDKLKVRSMKDWLSSGKSLADALVVLRGNTVEEETKEPPVEDTSPADEAGFDGLPSASAPPKSKIDPAWLQELPQKLLKAHWTEKTAISWCTAKFKIAGRPTLAETLESLSAEQRDAFVKELDSRIEMA